MVGWEDGWDGGFLDDSLDGCRDGCEEGWLDDCDLGSLDVSLASWLLV